MIKGNIPSKDRKNSYYCICYLDMLKTYHRETRLCEFSRDTNREELKKRNNDVTLQWLHFGVICLERMQNFSKN